MNKSILRYHSKSNIISLNESFKALTEYIVQSKQSRCTCMFSAEVGSKDFIKPQCKKMNAEFPQIVQQYASNGNSGSKSFFIEKNENNEQHFCPYLDSYAIINKLYYHQQFSIILGFENSISAKVAKTISHYESIFDSVIKSKYYDDINNTNQLDYKNLVAIIDEFGYLQYINAKLHTALSLSNDIDEIHFVDLIENHYDNWIGKITEVLNFKPFMTQDAKFKSIVGSINLRIKIFRGVWGSKPVFFITSLDINTFEIIPQSLNRKVEVTTQIEKNENTDCKIRLKVNNDYNMYNINEIVYCKLSSNYIEINLKDQSKTSMTNANLEVSNKLISKNFFQIHKSYIINLNHVFHYTTVKGCSVILTNNVKLEVSIRRKNKFLSIMSEFFL
ncbi:MAG: hypothetical protein A2033_15080 [Bacteroidetes bacterium GWA2_31_9]|nr:MAG: hypothetical protein A2033_15080 [Bacteroidetes bacterium GWA2_31_9]